ncbi:hypothetical protein SNEBB_010203 [Seison nebaliae]|nr:hypothetical protein SNEBB_010203 [Seison nebaliae]
MANDYLRQNQVLQLFRELTKKLINEEPQNVITFLIKELFEILKKSNSDEDVRDLEQIIETYFPRNNETNAKLENIKTNFLKKKLGINRELYKDIYGFISKEAASDISDKRGRFMNEAELENEILSVTHREPLEEKENNIKNIEELLHNRCKNYRQKNVAAELRLAEEAATIRDEIIEKDRELSDELAYLTRKKNLDDNNNFELLEELQAIQNEGILSETEKSSNEYEVLKQRWIKLLKYRSGPNEKIGTNYTKDSVQCPVCSISIKIKNNQLPKNPIGGINQFLKAVKGEPLTLEHIMATPLASSVEDEKLKKPSHLELDHPSTIPLNMNNLMTEKFNKLLNNDNKDNEENIWPKPEDSIPNETDQNNTLTERSNIYMSDSDTLEIENKQIIPEDNPALELTDFDDEGTFESKLLQQTNDFDYSAFARQNKINRRKLEVKKNVIGFGSSQTRDVTRPVSRSTNLPSNRSRPPSRASRKSSAKNRPVNKSTSSFSIKGNNINFESRK